ncbi:sulfite exporter TauE/SafE family protein [Breoghania sp. L-A4]|uniref:sulfite exporter TauE/SafE family protein n=1 Tax=Breoghania sp. L-A4 TaxID=2304600 RepID=UPI000E35ED2B|nr:sulfite exporter TauE/SafE family protein [Breoghania sp. L-A4]AXS41976.1 sulfite exporter TauE/SafE family protein [Breoghania sp. L-A4]
MILEILSGLVDEFGVWTFVGVAVVAIITSAIHGATGVAGGFLLAAALAPLIGVKPIIPVMSVALLISHSARAVLNFGDINRRAYLIVAIPAVPCIVAGAMVYGHLPSAAIALLLAVVILASIPLRRWAKAHNINATWRSLGGAGGVYGILSGASVGPGMLLIPFMLGYGLTKEAFVATLAVIALTTNITRVAVFGGTNLLDAHFIAIGVLVGLLTIPGNYLGRVALRRMNNDSHAGFVDVLTVLGAANFIWLAFKP